MALGDFDGMYMVLTRAELERYREYLTLNEVDGVLWWGHVRIVVQEEIPVSLIG